ncbi:hypothetical protein MSC49_37070 (plasmid) [Methylosinus sp. C49]|uniref:filamentous haemagglutinin family protein n=1 Tax=Methylosinus sp. C49 TaxID=2699395 RepID=UPI001366D0E3|nr:filamentous haemagglutinin family protein [Methylosinus sp. C49]BBU63772.1 hypothetical protein MSC49_37070 [Methylosinus sp. C49]
MSLIVLQGLDGAAARPLGRASGVTAAPTVAVDAATTEAQQAATIAKQSQGTLLRATQAIQAMQAAQAAARAAAAAATNSSIADGLSVGGNGKLPGLVVDPRVTTTPSLWINADLPTQSVSDGKTTVTIKQNAAQAVMTWAYYNVSPNTTVVYDQQGNPSWVALNRIDATGAPSQILGQIKADGTVLIINPNGIIFGAGAQINVHSLIASSLDIDGTTSSSVFNGAAAYNKMTLHIDGLGDIAAYAPSNEVAANNNFVGANAGQGLFPIATALGTTIGNSTRFSTGTIAEQTIGAVVVEKGASIETSVNSTGDGGYVALLAPNVTNSGSITTKNGQIILAAQGSVLLSEPQSTATGVHTAIVVDQDFSGGTNPTNKTFTVSYQGAAINDGLLLAPSGNVMIVGGAIEQLGVLATTTSVTRPGSITIYSTGDVVFGSDSVTAILPDEESGTVPTGTATTDYFNSSLQPQISITAFKGVDFQSGSLLRAPSAAVNLVAPEVLLESGATIDVSGLADVRVPISNFLVTFVVTPNEIADSPLAAALVGKTVTIDTRVGSPIVDASGYAKLIPKSIDEILTVGGSVSVSGTNFIQQPGSIVDISGGYVTYTGSVVNTTRLVGADGRFYDIGSADPTIRYVGVAAASGFTVDHSRWGVSETYVNPLMSRGNYESGYIAGASAGSLSIAAAPILAGTILGETVTGLRQRANALGGGTAVQTSLAQLPAGASLTINSTNSFVTSYLLESSADAGEDPYGLSTYSYGTNWRAPSTMPILTDRLSDIGFASITIRGSGSNQPTVNMATGAVLQVAPGGSITLTNVETIDGSLIARAGKITLSGHIYSSDLIPNSIPADLVIGPHALLDVHGLWINDAGAVGDRLQGSAFIDGGSISITTLAATYHRSPLDDSDNVDATQSIILSPGSVIDVSSGGYVGSNGKLKLGSDGLPVGKGGSLSLVTYLEGYSGLSNPPGLQIYNEQLTNGNQANAATVVLGGTIYSNGFDTGGTFTLQAPTITIDGQASAITSYTSGTRSGEIVLPASFFTDNGFSNYSLTSAYGGATVTAGTTVLLRQANYLASSDALLSLSTGASLHNVATVGLAPDGLRNPVSLTLAGGTTLLDAGARILAEANASKQATVTLTGGSVTVLGEIVAPGGDIVLAASGLSGGQLTIGADAALDASGVFVPDPTGTAYRTGSVLDAGTITLYGYSVVAREGSRFLLDGTSANVEIPSGGGLLGPRVATREIWSDGGVLQIGASSLYFAGSVSAHGGAELANGGLFRIGIPEASAPKVVSATGSSVVTVVNGYAGLPVSIVVEQAGVVAIALASNTALQGNAFVGVDTLTGGGFDSIELNAAQTVAFVGSQSIGVRGSLILGGNLVSLPADGVASDSARAVDLTAGYIWLKPVANVSVAATSGAGALTLTAEWIDVGNPSAGVAINNVVNFQNVGSVTLASADAIRLIGHISTNSTSDYATKGNSFVGSLGVAGDLTLKAAEIYPTSGTSFTLTASGTIAIEQTGVASQPLSAGGTIIVDAANIVQNGTLWAPFGQITLGNTTTTQSVTLGAGSLTSVSGAGTVVPYGYTVDGEVWYVGNTAYSLAADGTGVYQSYSLTSSPTKAITLNGADVATSAGAKLDLSGGGDFYASEFVAGTGGSRNVLAGSTVYALVPTSSAKVAAYDPTFAATNSDIGSAAFASSLLNAPAGTAIYIAGGNGIAAGYYTLMPGMYATLPGAYRVTVASTSVKSAAAQSYTSMDGSLYVTGNFANVISGTRSSQTVLFQLQSQSTWSQYSQIDITSGTSFIRNLALTAGTAIPLLPVDGGSLTYAARNSLSIDAGALFGFAAGSSPLAPDVAGVGGQLAISAAKVLVLGSEDTAAPTGKDDYLKLYADQLDTVGATTLLIGGSSVVDTSGNLVVSGVATDVEIATDAAHALSAPQLLIVTKAGGGGILVDDNSAIAAVGTAPAGADRAIVIGADPVAQTNSSGVVTYTAGVSGEGSLLRVSTGAMVTVTRNYLPGLYTGSGPAPTPAATPGSLVIGANVSIDGAAALTLDSSGVNRVGANATLVAKAFDLSAKAIEFGADSSSAGLALTDAVIANFAGADSVRLRSASAFNFHDVGGLSIGDAAHPIGLLIFDGGGFYSAGGETSVYASNITLTNTQSASTTTNGLIGIDGKLTLVASKTITQSAGTMTANGFSTIALQAGEAIRFAGTGSLTASNGSGVADVVLSSPNVIAVSGSAQALTTSGVLSIVSTGAATAVDATEIGGSLSLTAASIADSGAITVQAGTLSLTATTGDVTLADGAIVNAAGTRIVLGASTEYSPGGVVKLVSQKGNVTIASGAKVDVSAAKNADGSSGNGYAGGIYITTANDGTTTLQGTLDGSAAYKDAGGAFVLSTGTIVGDLPWGGFTSRFAAAIYQPGDIVVPMGATLSSTEVLLVANQGSVIVNGTIDASGPTGGGISLYGAGTTTLAATDPGATGVIIRSRAKLDAHYVAAEKDDPGYANGESAQSQRGGTITLGTTGATDGALNATYGYENVPGSGAVKVESGAIFDVSGGPGGDNVDNTGGVVVVRAPILTNNNVNVSFKGTVVTNADSSGNASGQGVVLDAFAVWSTTDSCPLISGGCGSITTVAQYNALTAAQKAQMQQHFDGIIDPAGFFSGAGAQIISATSGLYPTSTYAAPASGAYLPHVGFYQNTLLNFVENPFSGNAAAVAADFAEAKLQVGDRPATALPSTSLHLRPEVDLVNPSSSINGGNVTVASNWNLGAGVYNTATNAFSLYYRTTNGGEPGVLTLRAANNIQLNATISDGFYETSDPFFAAAVASSLASNDPSLALATTRYASRNLYGTAAYMPGMTSIYAPPTVFPSSYGTVAQNTWYAQYYYYYANTTIPYINILGRGASSLYITTNASGSGTFDNDPTHYSSYAAYVAAYNTFYVGSRYVTGVAGIANEATQTFSTPASSSNGTTQNLTNFDNNPTHYTSYANYASAYKTYSAALATYLKTYYGIYSQAPVNSSVDPRTYPSTILAPIPPVYGSVYSGGATETASQFTTDYVTNYATGTSSVYYNFILFYNGNKVEPGNVTGSAANTTGKTALWLAVLPYLPTTSETPPIVLASSAQPGPANAIANNPASNVTTDSLGNAVTIKDYNTTSAASLMPASFGASSSYDFVAGAYFGVGGASSVDPNAVVALSGAIDPKAPTASIVIDGHSTYSYTFAAPNTTTVTINVPTILRTGTGSITLTAAGNVEFADPIVQGAVYTAGAATTTPADFNAPTLASAYNANPNGLVSTPAWGTGGGSIVVNAGGSIIGVAAATESETWADWLIHYGSSDGDSTPFSGCAATGAAACQTAAWINYATFFQNFGALGGGDITLRAGRDIIDISASLPETMIVAGGFTAANPAHAIYYGGGNLLVQAGGDLNSSAFLVGRGAGLIEVGGDVQQTADNPITSAKDAALYPLLLAAQDGYISVIAKGDLTLGTLLDPTTATRGRLPSLTPSSYLPGSYSGNVFTSYGAQAGLSLVSLTGDVNAMNSVTTSLLPPSLEIAALLGDITVGGGTILAYPTDSLGHNTASLTLAAAGSINITLTVGAPTPRAIDSSVGGYVNPLGVSFYTLASTELTNSDPILVSAGGNLDGTLTVERPAQILVGRDIGDSTFTFTGLNFTDADVTSVVAGRDLSGNYYLYGPGALLIEAGRNIRKPLGSGTFASFSVNTIGNGSGGGKAGGQLATLKNYLPEEGADITMLYGIAKGVDYASAISAYVDPASAGTSGIDFLAFIAASLGQSRDQAWASFQTLDETHQHLLVDKAFLQFLTQVVTDYRNSASDYYGKYGRAYEAIGTLFPNGLGYANDGSGGSDLSAIGRLVMPFSLVETQAGGDINIIGPNGGIRVGSAGRDNLKPNQEGILTLRGGSIRIYTDQTVLVNQSRIMTQQGGNVEIFSGNGDINAGSGPKTYVANPVLSEVCNYIAGYCSVNPQGLVTGAGIGAIVTLPTQDPSLSNAFLSAPKGTVDLGAAGVRAAGNLTIVAQRVTNAYNAQVGGSVSGLTTVTTGPNVGALTSASNTAGAAAKAVATPQAGAGGSDTPSIITVEVLGYGGSDHGDTPAGGGASVTPTSAGSGSPETPPPANGAGSQSDRARRSR